jgi:hypothetical protein
MVPRQARSDDSGLRAAELAEIQARCDRATPGPWTSYVEGRDHVSGSSFIMTAGADIDRFGMSGDDQDFAAQARQDLPRLLAEVRRLHGLDAGTGPVAGEGGMEPGELAEIEARCERASAGPWVRSLVEMGGEYGPESVVTTGTGSRFELTGPTEADHELIAHARQDVPRLLAEVRRLRRELGLDGDATD